MNDSTNDSILEYRISLYKKYRVKKNKYRILHEFRYGDGEWITEHDRTTDDAMGYENSLSHLTECCLIGKVEKDYKDKLEEYKSKHPEFKGYYGPKFTKWFIFAITGGEPKDIGWDHQSIRNGEMHSWTCALKPVQNPEYHTKFFYESWETSKKEHRYNAFLLTLSFLIYPIMILIAWILGKIFS